VHSSWTTYAQFGAKLAERIVPGPNRSYIPLVVSNGKIEQQPYKEAGFTAVNFGTKNITNTIPSREAAKFLLPNFGRRTLENKGTQFEQMIGNARALMEHARSTGNLEAWSGFYNLAHQHAAELAGRYGISHLQASGVIASMSGGGGEWEINKENADRFLTARENGVDITPKMLSGVEGNRIANAHMIMNGHDARDVLGDMKERNFMESIHNPEGESITVDTHMHHGMTGWKRPWRISSIPEIGRNTGGGGAPGLDHPAVYNFMSEAIRGVSQEYGMHPNSGQSTMWYANKNLVGGKNGTPPPHHPNFETYFPGLIPGIRYRERG